LPARSAHGQVHFAFKFVWTSSAQVASADTRSHWFRQFPANSFQLILRAHRPEGRSARPTNKRLGWRAPISGRSTLFVDPRPYQPFRVLEAASFSLRAKHRPSSQRKRSDRNNQNRRTRSPRFSGFVKGAADVAETCVMTRSHSSRHILSSPAPSSSDDA